MQMTKIISEESPRINKQLLCWRSQGNYILKNQMLLVDADFNNNTWAVQTEVTHSEEFFLIFLTIYICCAAAAS